jgi:cysteinyl-tRNA synthetase
MVIRFFILQTHYRSTLDFGNEALKGAEKGLRRLWEAYENLQHLSITSDIATDEALNTNVLQLVADFDTFMNDDFNTAKVLANMFELVTIINGIKDKHIAPNAISSSTLSLLQTNMKIFVEEVFGLQPLQQQNNDKVDGVIQLLIEIRKQAKLRKDYVTSDKIRNELAGLGIQLKDEKDGSISYTLA